MPYPLVSDRADLRTIFMSGYERPDAGRQTHLSPDDHLIGKPFSPSELVERIVEVLADDGRPA